MTMLVSVAFAWIWGQQSKAKSRYVLAANAPFFIAVLICNIGDAFDKTELTSLQRSEAEAWRYFAYIFVYFPALLCSLVATALVSVSSVNHDKSANPSINTDAAR